MCKYAKSEQGIVSDEGFNDITPSIVQSLQFLDGVQAACLPTALPTGSGKFSALSISLWGLSW